MWSTPTVTSNGSAKRVVARRAVRVDDRARERLGPRSTRRRRRPGGPPSSGAGAGTARGHGSVSRHEPASGTPGPTQGEQRHGAAAHARPPVRTARRRRIVTTYSPGTSTRASSSRTASQPKVLVVGRPRRRPARSGWRRSRRRRSWSSSPPRRSPHRSPGRSDGGASPPGASPASPPAGLHRRHRRRAVAAAIAGAVTPSPPAPSSVSRLLVPVAVPHGPAPALSHAAGCGRRLGEHVAC